MKGLRRTLAFLMLFSCLAMAGDSVGALYKKGVKAEARQDYEAAYDFYKAAYDKHPEDLKYRLPYERMRSLAAATKIRRGQKLREIGQLQEALQMFEKAVEIDSSNDLALQEIRKTKEMIAQPATPPKAQEAPPRELDDLHKILDEAGGPVRLAALSNVPMQAIKMPNADSKNIYETIGKIAGINVLFDPDYTSRRLTVDLQGVTLTQALDIVGLESRTFWRPVTPNTIFVAADSQAKRRELEQSVIKTFYLGNVSTPTDLQDVVNAIRTILEVQRIQQIPSQNAIVVRGTPDQLALAQKMIDDIDKSKPEVIVEVLVAQVRRDKVRQLGIVPPQKASVTLVGTNVNNPSTSGGSTTTTTTSGSGLNFNNLQHLNSTNYSVTIDPLTAQAIFSDNNTKILQNPQIRAGDGVKASLKIGDRIPVATGSFGTPTGIAGVGNLGVNTQFQYLDVGVNIDITPHVHPDGEISLKVQLDVSSQTGTATIGNVTQPIISQRKVEQEIRLRDGEVNLLGGILEEQETANTSGTPFLAQIPILKYLFSNNDKEKHQNEVVFMLVPRIVRGQELSSLNRRTFDVGTGTGIDLRMAEKPVKPETVAAATKPPAAPGVAPVSATPPPKTTPTPAPTTPAPAAQPPAAQQPPATQPPATAGTVLRLEPSTATPARGSTFGLSVAISGAEDINSVPVQISYDPKLIQFITVSTGGFLGKDGQPVALVHRDDPIAGKLQVMAQRSPGIKGVSGDGVVFSMVFTAKAPGSGTITIVNPAPRNSQNQQVQVTTANATVTIN